MYIVFIVFSLWPCAAASFFYFDDGVEILNGCVESRAMISDVSEQLSEVLERVKAAEVRSGRGSGSVKLVAVSKTWPVDHIQKVVDEGHRVLGENKLQEGLEKIPVMDPELEWHFIGGLQRNKVRKVLGLFQWVHSLDSLKLLRYTDGVAGDMGLQPKVLLQVNIGRELSKGGFEVEELEGCFEDVLSFKNLDIQGLMCIPPASEGADARSYFQEMVGIQKRLESEYGVSLPELSMGMSGDFEVAIEEGATMVRVGSSIFGHRSYS